MNPTLLIVAAATGLILLIVAVIGAALAWFPLPAALVLGGIGLAVETLAVLALVRSRRRAGAPTSSARG